MTDGEMLYQKFRAPSQEPVRLQLALQGLFPEEADEMLRQAFQEYTRTDATVTALYDALRRFRGLTQTLPDFLAANRNSLEVKRRNGLITSEEEKHETWVLRRLEEMEASVRAEHLREPGAVFSHLKALFAEDLTERTQAIGKTHSALENGFRYVADSFGDGQEMIFLVSSLTRMPGALDFIRCHGCEPYLKYAQALLYRRQEAKLQQACRKLL